MCLSLVHSDLDRNYHEGLMKGKDWCTAPIALDHFGRRDLGEGGIIWCHIALKLCKKVWKDIRMSGRMFFFAYCVLRTL